MNQSSRTPGNTIVFVTGAGRGIGFEVARQVARRGAQVHIGVRSEEAGNAALQKLQAEGLTARWHLLEVTDGASLAALAKALERDPGRIDVLVNNAGIYSKADGPATSVAADIVLGTFGTNSLGPLRVAQALLPLLRKSSEGRIVNVSSGMGALEGMEGGSAAYRISKTALNAVSAVLAAELKGERIAVNSACPGWVRTDMGGASAPRDVTEGADTVVWLALDAPRTLTGKLVRDRKVIPW